MPFELGIIRNHYVGRTFIQPTQKRPRTRRAHEAFGQPRRHRGQAHRADRRFSRARHHLEEDRQDDARRRRQEVHFRIASPPITHPDYYGIDTPDRAGLLAATHTLEEMRDLIGADSLAFVSVDGIYRAMGDDPAAIPPIRNSPTTASPATTRPRSPT
jgi:amidophosphoribosyltransferase